MHKQDTYVCLTDATRYLLCKFSLNLKKNRFIKLCNTYIIKKKMVHLNMTLNDMCYSGLRQSTYYDLSVKFLNSANEI